MLILLPNDYGKARFYQGYTGQFTSDMQVHQNILLTLSKVRQSLKKQFVHFIVSNLVTLSWLSEISRAVGMNVLNVFLSDVCKESNILKL